MQQMNQNQYHYMQQNHQNLAPCSTLNKLRTLPWPHNNISIDVDVFFWTFSRSREHYSLYRKYFIHVEFADWCRADAKQLVVLVVLPWLKAVTVFQFLLCCQERWQQLWQGTSCHSHSHFGGYCTAVSWSLKSTAAFDKDRRTAMINWSHHCICLGYVRTRVCVCVCERERETINAMRFTCSWPHIALTDSRQFHNYIHFEVVVAWRRKDY